VEKKFNRLDDFFEVRQLILGSQTNKGFISGIVERLMLQLRTHPLTQHIVVEWERQIIEKQSLRFLGYQELQVAIEEIRFKINESTKLLAGFGSILEAIIESVRCWGNFYEVNPLVPYSAHPDFPIPTIEPPYERIYRKLHGLYVQVISKSWEQPFAPTALQLMEWDGAGKFRELCDRNPAYLWWRLMMLEEAWTVIDQQLSVWWSRTEGEGVEMLLEADQKFRTAFRNKRAIDLSYADNPSEGLLRFDRRGYNQLIQRLFIELNLKINKTGLTCDPKAKKSDNQGFKSNDEKIVVQHWSNFCRDKPGFKQKHAIEWIKKEIRDRAIIISAASYADSTYRSWIRRHELQSFTPKRGKAQGKA
jgi:hypothetical protein